MHGIAAQPFGIYISRLIYQKNNVTNLVLLNHKLHTQKDKKYL